MAVIALEKLLVQCERQKRKQIITIPHNKGGNEVIETGSGDNNTINSLEELVPSSKTLGPKKPIETHRAI